MARSTSAGRRQPHHLQGTDGLVQLLARDAQLAGIKRCKIGTAGRFGFAHKALERLRGTFERFAEFVKHPRQRTQIVHGEVKFGGC